MESRSLAQAADALGKLATMLGVPVELLWEKIPGFTEQDVDRAKTILQLATVFALLDPDDLDGTFADWLFVVSALINARRTESANLAGAYLTAQRTLELGAPTEIILAPPVDEKTLSVSMLVTGPASLRANRARHVDQALDIAKARSSAAGMRHVLNAGRETIAATVMADPEARGYRRVISANACKFCSMLAGRGPVYKSERTATFSRDGHHYHDGCACTAEPVYR
jgi:hypothetical protein